VLGTGEVEGDLVLVEAWREGPTLREALDAGGPLTPALAARVGVEVAGALQACQALPDAQGRPLCHGAVRAERILLADDGAVLLCGTGRPFSDEASLADDLRNLARVLLESLPPPVGEAPGALAAVLDRVLVGDGYASATAFAEAIAGAVAPADPSAVAARAEASQPAGTPAWLSRRRALAQALHSEEEAHSGEVDRVAAGARVDGPAAEASPGQDHLPRPPPPLPGVETVGGAGSPAAAQAARLEARDQFFEVEGDAPGPDGPPASVAGPPPAVGPVPAWIQHRRAPLAVAVLGGLIGLLLGLALGQR
jgi:hypothetical protein